MQFEPRLAASTRFPEANHVSSFGSSGAEYFGGMAQECVRWLIGWIGPGLVADPGSVTTDRSSGRPKRGTVLVTEAGCSTDHCYLRRRSYSRPPPLSVRQQSGGDLRRDLRRSIPKVAIG